MAVLYAFGLYVLYVLLPIIPAAVLFRLFPDTKVAVSGPLQNLTLNSTGAFGGYVVTAFLSFFVVQDVRAQINDLSTDKVWRVTVPVQLVDTTGMPISGDDEITSDADLEFNQRLYVEGDGEIFITVPIVNDEWRTIKVIKPGFVTASVSLQSLVDKKDRTKAEIDPVKRRINILKPLVLKKVPETSDAPYREQSPLPAWSGGIAPAP